MFHAYQGLNFEKATWKSQWEISGFFEADAPVFSNPLVDTGCDSAQFKLSIDPFHSDHSIW